MSARLKKLMPIGSEWTSELGDFVVNGNLGQTTLKPYTGRRVVKAHRSKDMVFTLLEEPKVGVDSYLNYPKAADIEELDGGRIRLANHGSPLTYTPAK